MPTSDVSADAKTTARDAYIYGYPLVLTQRTKK